MQRRDALLSCLKYYEQSRSVMITLSLYFSHRSISLHRYVSRGWLVDHIVKMCAPKPCLKPARVCALQTCEDDTHQRATNNHWPTNTTHDDALDE